jgi:hypothetical protein
VLRHGARQVEVQHAGLDPGHPFVDVDLENAVHLRRDHDDGRQFGQRHGTAREAGPRAARHDRPVVLVGDHHDGLHLGSGQREADDSRAALEH